MLMLARTYRIHRGQIKRVDDDATTLAAYGATFGA